MSQKTENIPECIILHGTKYRICNYKTIVNFVDKVRSKGNTCEFYTFENFDHILTSSKE